MKTNKLLLVILLIVFLTCSTSKERDVKISKMELMNKIKGGWAGQTIGVCYGKPMEFKYKQRMIPDSVQIDLTEEKIKKSREGLPRVKEKKSVLEKYLKYSLTVEMMPTSGFIRVNDEKLLAVKKNGEEKKSRSVLKNIRKTARRRAINVVKKKKLKSAIKKLKKMTSKKEALKIYPDVQTIIDKSIQDGIIKKNTAARYKSHLMKYINNLK